MTQLDFVKEIITLYQNNASIEGHPQVVRGRGRTISSETEDLFGIYISQLLGQGYEIFVDIRIKVDGVKEAFFPDIAICKDKIVLQMWDLKMDLGWIRGKLWKMIATNKILISKIEDKPINARIKHLGSYKFSRDITYNFAIITLSNGGKDANKVYDYATNKVIEDEKCMKDEKSKVFFIFKHRSMRKNDPEFKHDDYHPNSGFEYTVDNKNKNKDKRPYDLEQKMSYGTFNELDKFILSVKNLDTI